MLDIDRVRANPHAKILVNFPGGTTVESFITEDQGFTFGNNFDAPFESIGQNISDLVTKASAAGGMLGVGEITGGLSQYGIKTVQQTMYAYANSERLRISLRLVFIATKPTDDVRVMTSPFRRATNATFEDVRVIAPLRYNVKGLGLLDVDGTMGIQIGQWFRTPPIFIAKAFTPTYSKATTHAGFPLYCMANVEFEAYRMLSADEIEDFFA